MTYYKDLEGKLHFIDSDEFEHLLPAGSVRISDEEANVIQTPPQPSPEEIIKAQILEIEATITQRRLREAMLSMDDGWLAKANADIEALRDQLP